MGGVEGTKYCTINKRSKGMSEVLEVWNTVLYYEQLIKGYVCQRCRKWCLLLLHNTATRVKLLMSEVSKVYCTLYTVASRPCQEGRLFVTVFEKAFHLGGLAVHYQSVQVGSFVNFLGLVKYKGDCRQNKHSQSPILKIKGVLSNLVILTYLWEQSCPNQTACLV